MNWKPFFIDPSTKAEGEDYKAYCRRRWGGDGWTNSLPGKREGSKFQNWKVWPNTLLAVRLLHLAEEKGGWQLQHKVCKEHTHTCERMHMPHSTRRNYSPNRLDTHTHMRVHHHAHCANTTEFSSQSHTHKKGAD